jgi:hypothetical protein
MEYKFRIETKDIQIIPGDGFININFNSDSNEQLLLDVTDIINTLTPEDLNYEESTNLLIAVQNVIKKETGR